MMTNNSGVVPVGHTVLILPDPIKETSEAGIILGTPDSLERQYLAQTEGVVLAIGEHAWKEWGAPFCKVGDRVIFPKFTGCMRMVERKETVDGKEVIRKEQYRLINDIDVKAIVGESHE